MGRERSGDIPVNIRWRRAEILLFQIATARNPRDKSQPIGVFSSGIAERKGSDLGVRLSER